MRGKERFGTALLSHPNNFISIIWEGDVAYFVVTFLRNDCLRLTPSLFSYSFFTLSNYFCGKPVPLGAINYEGDGTGSLAPLLEMV